jgi:hypothetical protein
MKTQRIATVLMIYPNWPRLGRVAFCAPHSGTGLCLANIHAALQAAAFAKQPELAAEIALRSGFSVRNALCPANTYSDGRIIALDEPAIYAGATVRVEIAMPYAAVTTVTAHLLQRSSASFERRT